MPGSEELEQVEKRSQFPIHLHRLIRSIYWDRSLVERLLTS